MNYYNTYSMQFELRDETIVVITAQDDNGFNIKVAQFNFLENGSKFYYDLKGNQKEVTRISTILNYLFKNGMQWWSDKEIKTAKENAKRIKSEENKAYKQELKQRDELKANEMIQGIKEHEEKYINICKNIEKYDDEKLFEMVTNTFKHASKKVLNEVYNTINDYNSGKIEIVEVLVENNEAAIQDTTTLVNESTYTVFNRSFTSYEHAVKYCNESDFDTDYIEKVITVQPSTQVEEPEVFHLYSNTFNTYMDAYNHAINNKIAVTMILSNKHQTMTNKRLQELEKSYVFDKSNMDYDSMKEYYTYLDGLFETLDKQDRYYKLRSWITRHENSMKSKQEEQDRLKMLAQEVSDTLKYMVDNGLEIKEKESYVQWNYNGEKVYSWFSGIHLNEYHKEAMDVYNRYFSEVV